MKRELRPDVEEVVYAYGIASLLMWGLTAGVVLLIGLPQAYVFPLLQVVALIAAAYFALKSAQALWLHLTEHYCIEDGWVRIEGGLISRYRTGFQLENVRKTWVGLPPLFRIFGIGHVWVSTFDCCAFKLRNLKYPYRVADEILPPQSSEPILRPSVG